MKRLLLALLLIATPALADYTALGLPNKFFDTAHSCTANTADTADNASLCLSGGGGTCGDPTRGSSCTFTGNEGGGDGVIQCKTGGDSGGVFDIVPHGDANRHFAFDAASDTAHTLKFGDGGTTPSQTLTISGSSDDVYLNLFGGSSNSQGSGAGVVLEGNAVGGAGQGGGLFLRPGSGADGSIFMDMAYGTRRKIRSVTAESGGMTGSTTTFSNLIPAKSTYLGCVVRVTILITGATSFNIGDGTDADRWGAAIAPTATTTTTQASFTATPYGWSATAISPVLTAVGSNFTAGAVRMTCFIEDFTGPTS